MKQCQTIGFAVLLLLGALPFIGETAAVDKPEPATSQPFSPFGIGGCHINNRSTTDFARWIPQMAEIGIQELRTCNTNWASVEPEHGQFEWDNLDKQKKYLDDATIRYTVPDNNEWQTVKWKINGVQFMNYWGYNFALESDGNKLNKYFIQNVTVAKLPTK